MKPVLRFMMLRIVCCPFICKISLHLKLFLSALSIYLYVCLSICLCVCVCLSMFVSHVSDVQVAFELSI